MNRLFIIAILALAPVLSFAQRAMVTFSFTMTQSGSQLSVDSIYVENLSSQCDTMLYSPTASLKVYVLAGIENVQKAEENLRAESWHFDATDNSVCVCAFVPNKKVKVKTEIYKKSKV